MTKYSPLSLIIIINLFIFSYLSMYTHDLMILWFFLEINNFMFIYMLNMFMNNKKMIFLYFIIQIMSSFMMMFSIIINNMFMPNNHIFLILILTLLIKLSIPPFHFWLPMISNYLPWNMLLLLLTIQKITPFYIMSLCKFNNFSIMYMILIMTSIIPPLMSLNLLNFKMIMAYSSINQSGWMLMLIYMKTIIWFKYFIFYSFTLLLIIYTFYYFKMLKNSSTLNTNINFNLFILLMMFNMAGLPPFSMFYLKWYSIFLFMKLNNLIFILMLMMFSSLLMLYIYSNMILNSLFFFKIKSKLIKFKPTNLMSFFMMPLMFLSSLLMMI